MAELDQRLRELEESLTSSEKPQQKATMPNNDEKPAKNIPYLYIVGGMVPIVTAAALYFLRPKFITIKKKNKKVVNNRKLIMWTAGITILFWLLLFAGKYFGIYKKFTEKS